MGVDEGNLLSIVMNVERYRLYLQVAVIVYCRSSGFSSSTVRPSGPTAFASAIAFIAVATSSSVGSVPRALATGCCSSLLWDVGNKHVRFRVQQRAEESHPSLGDTPQFKHPSNQGEKTVFFLKKNQTTPRPSEHPPVMGEKCQNV